MTTDATGGELSPRVLLVDDEPHVLDGLRRVLRGQFATETAVGPTEGLERLAQDPPYDVVVSDFAMPQMNGAQFLAAARALCPDTSRVLLTGQADLGGAAAVVNEGGILRLLLKPASRDDLVAALRAGVDQRRLVLAERDLLDNTLRGSVRALTEVLALANPTLFARSVRLRDLVAAISLATGHELPWHVELAAMLADVGAIAVPISVVERAERGHVLDDDEQAMLANLPTIADQVLAGIPRIEDVRTAIRTQNARFDSHQVPLGGRLLAVARAYDALESAGRTPGVAVATLRTRVGVYDPVLLDALAAVASSRAVRVPEHVSLSALTVGMTLAENVTTADGTKLVAKGNELSLAQLTRIRNFAQHAAGVREPILVFAP